MAERTSGFVEAIYVAAEAAAPSVAVEVAEAVAERGLRGDRYGEKRGSGTGWDECQVTLIAGEDLDAAAASGVRVHAGEHRRNIVTRGCSLDALTDQSFRIGTAVFVWDRPRPPCRWLANLTDPRMPEALAGRSGVCVRVIGSGTVRAGDPIVLL